MRRLQLPGGAVLVLSVSLVLLSGSSANAVGPRVARLDPYLRRAAILAHQLDTPSTRARAMAHLRQLDHTVALEPDATPPAAVVRVAGHPSRNALSAIGAELVSHGAASRLVRVPLRALERLSALSGVRFVEAQARVRPRLDISVPLTGAQALHESDPTVTGAGVVYGSIDDGIDIRHPTFRNPDGTTRVEAFWDVCDESGDPPPGFEDFGGTLYTAEDINAELEGRNRFPHVDFGGHGTMTGGIGAGNGAGGEYVGMAPEAAIVVVAIFGLDAMGTCENSNVANDFGGGSSVVSEGARFIEWWAGDRPFVVNMSIGDHVGPHDGSSLLDRDLEEIATSAPGRALVAAAGNEAEGGVHAGVLLPADGQVFGIDAAGQFGYDGSVEIWYPADAQVEVRVRQGETCGRPVDKGEDWLADAYYVDNARDGVDARNGDNAALVEMYGDIQPAGDEELCTTACDAFTQRCGGDPFGAAGACFARCVSAWDAERVDCVENYVPRRGNGCNSTFYRCLAVSFTVELRAVGDEPVRVDLYGAGFATAIDAPGPDMTIGEPASSHGTIATAAFVHRGGQLAQGSLGDLTDYSSHGPLRDGRSKPEIAAPAELVTSAMADGYDPFGVTTSDDGLWMTLSGGTSAASPHAAGAVALLLQEHPEATLEAIHEALGRGADADSHTDTPPNDGWGWGKLRVDRALTALQDVPTDADGDGFGDAAEGGLDCDDSSAEVGPRIGEIVGNGKDDDCDGEIDEPLPEGGFFERFDPVCPDEVSVDGGTDGGPAASDAGPDGSVDVDAGDGEQDGGTTLPPGKHARGGGCSCRTAPVDGSEDFGLLAGLGLALALAASRRRRAPSDQ